MGVTRWAPSAALALVLAACGGSVEFPVQDGVIEAEVDTSDRAALGALRDLIDERWERWEAHGIDSYDIEYRVLSYGDCEPAATVSVAAGRDVRLTPDACADEAGGVTTYTVDGLFGLARRAVADPAAEGVSVVFDAVLGYPHRVYVDWDVQLPDDEVGVSVLGFRRQP